jgi:hypothetical protein
VPSRAKITTSTVFVCLKFGGECRTSARKIRREVQTNSRILCFRSSFRVGTLLFRIGEDSICSCHGREKTKTLL